MGLSLTWTGVFQGPPIPGSDLGLPKGHPVSEGAVCKELKRKKDMEVVDTTPQKKQQKKPTKCTNNDCFFCRAEGHVKKHCSNYHAWRAKKGLPELSKIK